MLSQLGPLFKTLFRQAESTDTWQGIRLDEKKDGRRKQDFEEKADDSDLWEDSTGVSVDALHAFLVNFLKNPHVIAASQKQAPSAKTSSPSAPAAETAKQPVNTATARAVSAYQTMSDKTHPPEFSAPPEDKTLTEVDLLQASDVRVIHGLIADLEDLFAKGVTQLTIEKADTFLQSLQNAVEKAKSDS